MGRVYAVLGDIHANIDALNAVLDDARAQGVTHFVCVGDVVGYNAAPAACIRAVRDELGCPCVRGNHDHYVSDPGTNLADFHPSAAQVVEWTRSQLAADDVQWLHDLPLQKPVMGFMLVHATLDKPDHWGYVFENQQAEANFSYQYTPLCFHGHTHVPIIYSNEPGGVVHYQPRDFTLELGQRLFINVGSVGQPRDGDPRASYVVYDMAARQVRFRRVAYDVQAAMARNRLAGLPEKCASRLEIGR
ncbi:MAG: metallophosphoesterase family protein [bacterium]|nr:metallophosphoesterase family protein [bacterium]